MYSFNYSSLKNRDKRIYSVNKTKIPGGAGASVSYLKILAATFLFFNIIGIIICIIKGEFLYSPIDENYNIKIYFPAFFIFILPFSFSSLLHSYKILNYRMIDFLVAALKKKHIKNKDNKIVKLKNYKDSCITIKEDS